MIVLKVSLLLCLLTTVLSHDQQALRFGNDLTSYIMINPDMTPLEEALSVCSWIKQLSRTSRRGTWLYYSTVERGDEILISDDLRWAFLTYGHISHCQTPSQSVWYHICLTWSYRSRTNTLYYNGRVAQIGTPTTPSGRKFSVAEGSIVLGQYHRTYKMEASFGNGYSFGGEMSKMNIFKRTLSAEEVAAMYNSGICSDYEDSLQDDIHLSWETLLSDETQKHGNVRPIDLSCPDHTHEPTMEIATTVRPTTKKSTTVGPITNRSTTVRPTNPNSTTVATVGPTEESTGCADHWAILRLPDFYNKVNIIYSFNHFFFF